MYARSLFALLLPLSLLASKGALAANTAATQAECAAALAEAVSVRNDFGVWRGEARVLTAHRRDANYADRFGPMAKTHAQHWSPLMARLTAVDKQQSDLHRTGPCPQDAETAAALATAWKFMSMSNVPQRVPLPAGYCRGSPDLDAPLIPCKTPAP